MRAKPVEIDWNPGMSIYASEKFLRIVGDEYGWLGGTDDSGKLRCILPYTIIRKASVRMVRFRIEIIPIEENFSIEEEKAFLNDCIEYFRSIGADVVIPATTNTIFRTYPDRAIAAPYGTLIIDLTQEKETIFKKFSTSHRRKVRLATKADVQIRSSTKYIETAYKLIQDTLKRSSLTFMSYTAFEQMVLGLGENIKILVAEYQNTIQGCLVIPFSKYSAYYVYGGSIPDPIPGAMNLTHWEAIKMFHDLGVNRYDFCGVRIDPEKGSKQEGLLMFKERFGPKLHQGFMWKCSINPLKSAVYNLAVRFSRGGDLVDAEHHKLTHS